MRALTLTQPWCGLVASGIKLVENRPRAMIKSEDFGKRFALHASREIDDSVYRRLADLDPAFELGQVAAAEPWYKLSRITSAVIGVATIRDALYIGGNSEETTLAMLTKLGLADQMRFTFGPTVYVLGDVISLPEPVKCRGWQGFWTMTPELADAVNTQLVGAVA